ncbi:nuclear envelope pore membrane protein pom 121 [Ophiostoma piceae UAMH 11346]|uniref:Nuclear envelope pore membrane protein pom 121 n=1 Tax=Ophiostoma piceae (strain UAMH 11346) TaxID=1262450 RepID=S3CAX8_OPHP1|nr:nuclear envelope pore membrane protein pom 121 [Ophiostoma piceae UAMH 11346]
METPQKRQKSWFSSLTGLVSGSRATAPENAPSTSATPSARAGASLTNGNGASSRVRLTRLNEQTPARHSGTFSAPPVESPESPVKRASPTRLAQRKMHDRVQGPSGRVGASSANLHNNAPNPSYAYNTNLYSSASLGRATATPRRTTNFTSATTPRNMFRESLSRDMPSFSFTPRVPTNTMRGNFPAITPGRSLRAPGAELGTRDMDKVASTEHFAMNIPDPDPELTGEAISKMVPEELKGKPEGMYANHYLAHLCPPEFSEEQRNQFFCILDLRRLKYGANNVFAKQDWKFNIANFAKEYEKSRSMILLRYGLYTFKTVKVSQDVFDKWRATNDVPDPQGEKDDAASPEGSTLTRPTLSAPKTNGTEGILRSGKRKAQDNIDPSATAAFLPGTKRSRALDGTKTTTTAEREPLTETSTPALNKSKRKATRPENADQLQRAKIQKPAQTGTPAATTSATKAFFEKVANSPAKETSTAAASTPSIQVSKPASDSSPSPTPPSLFKSSTLAPTVKPSTNGSLARSVLENGLKASTATATTAQNGNIFGYLSDASSAKGSGNDNADADGEDTDDSDGQEESEAQDASDVRSVSASAGTSTPQPTASLFSAKPATSSLAPTLSNAAAASGASSDASDSGASRSLFDRVNKGTDGQPIRAFGSEGASSTPKPASVTSLFGSKPSSERASPEKETSSLFSGNKTWNPDSPIKFAGGASSTPAAKPLFGAASSTTPATSSPFKLGGSTTPAPSTEKPAAAEKAADTASAAAPLFGFLNKSADVPASSSASPSLFGASTNKPASTPATAAPAASTSASTLFGASNTQSASSSLFGKPTPSTTASTSGPATTSTTAAAAAPLFGASSSTPGPSSSTLFGNAAAKSDTPSFSLKRTAEDDSAPKAAPSFGSGSSTLFGNTEKTNGSVSGDEPQAKKTMFGAGSSAPAAASSSSLFSFGAPKTNGDTSKPVESAAPKPLLFGATPTSSAPEASKTGNLFGNSTPAVSAPPSSSSMFGFGAAAPATTAPLAPSGNLFSFGSSTAAPAQSSGGLNFGGGNGTGSAGSSFNFSAGGAATAGASQSFRNPFASGDSTAATPTPSGFSFGGSTTNGQSGGAAPSLFQFGNANSTQAAAPAPSAGGSLFSFGGSQTTEAATTPGNSFNNAAPTSNGLGSSTMFSFGGAGASSQPSTSTPLFGMQPAATGSMFNLAPAMAGASTGTNTPFTNLGGASSLATTPATGTPEPGANQNNADNSGHQADGDEAPQEQISLTEGGPGEEDEAVVHEVRAKALKLVTKDESESESPGPKEKKSPWRTEGVGPLRILKNKATGAVRLLLRAEPRGHIALNRALLPDFTYKPEPNAKYVKLTTANETGTGLETWMLQVKTKEFAQALADALEENKAANKK